MSYKNPEDRRAYQRAYRKLHRKKMNAYARAYSRRRREKFPSHMRAYKRAYDLRRNYGLTEQEFQLKLDQQGGCGICETRHPGRSGWQIDHDHKTNKVRGILCSQCNWMLGNAKDSVTVLRSGAKYIEIHKRSA